MELYEELKNIANIEDYILGKSDIATDVAKLRSQIDYNAFLVNQINENINHIQEMSKANNNDNIFNNISNIYEEAKFFKIDSIMRDFQQTVVFYKKLINNEIQFMQQKKEKLETEIEAYKNELFEKFGSNVNNEYYDAIIKIMGEIENTSNEISQINVKLKSAIEHTNKVKELEEEIQELILEAKDDIQKFKSNLIRFNEIFGEYSKYLINEFKVSLGYNDAEGKFHIDIDNHLGAGDERASVLLFDIAYYLFAQGQEMTIPSFIIGDFIEDIDDELGSIFNLIIKDLQNSPQVILPIVKRDKHSLQSYIDNYKILDLSLENRLFNIK